MPVNAEAATPVTTYPESLPPPPPAEIKYSSEHLRNPLEQVSFKHLCSKLPSVMRSIARMAWRIDPWGVLLLLACQLATGVAAGVLLSATADVMQPLLGSGPVDERLRNAVPALLIVAAAAALARLAGALAMYGERRITPRLVTEADAALVEAICRVEADAYAVDGFADRQEAAEMGVTRTHAMINDAQRFMTALIRLVTASGVLSVLHPLMLPLLVLAVLPAGIGAVRSARVDYEIHYANVADRNVRGMMRWWATSSNFADEVRANNMADYLLFWHRSLSERVDHRTVTAAPRTLRIGLVASAVGGLLLIATWTVLGWLAVTGRVAPAIAATAVVAVQTILAALSQIVTNGAAVFHTSLYLNDMQTFLDIAEQHASRRGELNVSVPLEKIGLENVSYQYPGRSAPAVDRVSLTLRRGEILAIVGTNGSGKSTLTRLIAGIHLAGEGRVTWNGTDLALADPSSVWRNTGLVPQLFAQWPLTVRENVTLGQPRTSGDACVWEAIDAVGMREVVEQLPNALDTLLAREVYGGVELSGGQWQRLACSRALYRKPALLVLDEPTSNMDPRGEHSIFERIKAHSDGRITIVVTHRLENTKMADRIICMEDGRIVEQGDYNSLVSANGLFAELLTLTQDR